MACPIQLTNRRLNTRVSHSTLARSCVNRGRVVLEAPLFDLLRISAWRSHSRSALKRTRNTSRHPIQAQTIPLRACGRDASASPDRYRTDGAFARSESCHRILENRPRVSEDLPVLVASAPAKVGQILDSLGHGRHIRLPSAWRSARSDGLPGKIGYAGRRVMVATHGRPARPRQSNGLKLTGRVPGAAEADRNDDMGFINDIRQARRQDADQGQTLFFSGDDAQERRARPKRCCVTPPRSGDPVRLDRRQHHSGITRSISRPKTPCWRNAEQETVNRRLVFTRTSMARKGGEGPRERRHAPPAIMATNAEPPRAHAGGIRTGEIALVATDIAAAASTSTASAMW